MLSTHLRGHTPETLAAAFPGLSLPVARRVLHRLVGENRDELDGVPGLSKVLARELRERGRLDRLEIVDRRRSEVDPFVKYLFRAADGRVFEAVRIPLEQPRFSICLSSQVGCALACAFCRSLGHSPVTNVKRPGRCCTSSDASIRARSCSPGTLISLAVRHRAWRPRRRRRVGRR